MALEWRERLTVLASTLLKKGSSPKKSKKKNTAWGGIMSVILVRVRGEKVLLQRRGGGLSPRSGECGLGGSKYLRFWEKGGERLELIK